jgi:hypothetical protein
VLQNFLQRDHVRPQPFQLRHDQRQPFRPLRFVVVQVERDQRQALRVFGPPFGCVAAKRGQDEQQADDGVDAGSDAHFDSWGLVAPIVAAAICAPRTKHRTGVTSARYIQK